MTRARDTLIVAVPASNPREGAWIESFRSEHLLPSGDQHPLPGGDPIPSAALKLDSDESSDPVPVSFSPAWFVERVPTEIRLRERVTPSEAAPMDGATVAEDRRGRTAYRGSRR